LRKDAYKNKGIVQRLYPRFYKQVLPLNVRICMRILLKFIERRVQNTYSQPHKTYVTKLI